jgi:hypothetical protein
VREAEIANGFQDRSLMLDCVLTRPLERQAMKMTILFSALLLAGATPVLACDYHATHTTAADENSTAVVCDNSGCHSLETSTAQQYQTTEPTLVAAQSDK